MKVLLVRHPEVHVENDGHVSGIPLGLLYIASALENAGHEVQVYDAVVQANTDDSKEQGPEGMYHLGATWDEIRSVVACASADVVGISSQYTNQTPSAMKTAAVVREASKSATIIVGGASVSIMPAAFLDECEAVDYAVIGEGEETLVELLACLGSDDDKRSISGIAYRDEAKTIITDKRIAIEDLDALPLPAYHLVDMERYFSFNAAGKDGRNTYAYPGSERSISMITSRGCPFSCTFCSIHLSMGKQFRAHSVSNVLSHLEHVKKNYGVNHVHFEDDNLSFDMGRFDSLLDGMLANDYSITWDTPNGVRADYLDEAVLTKCRDSGCTYLRLGVESGNEEVGRLIVRKALDLTKVVEISKLCRKIGIDLEAFYIIGFPGETVAQMKDTIDFAVSMERKYGLLPFDMFTAIPLVGTELYRISKERGYLTEEKIVEKVPEDSNFIAGWVGMQNPGKVKTEEFSSETITGLRRGYARRHLGARVIYSIKFLLRHPRYLLVRLGDRAFLRQLVKALRERKFRAVVNDVFLYRYKNCVLRKVGHQASTDTRSHPPSPLEIQRSSGGANIGEDTEVASYS